MIASLPMYTTTRNTGVENRFWAEIRTKLQENGTAAPDHLTRDLPEDLIAHWLSRDLVLSQTCSLPYRTRLRRDVTIVGTPDYGIPGCPPGYYQSVVIVRGDDPRDGITEFATARFALNDPLSQSGWAALVLERPDLLLTPSLITGSHRASISAVMQSYADFAAIDAITFGNLTILGETTGLRVIHKTAPSPGLPYITAKSNDAAALLSAMQNALSALSHDDRDLLGIKSIIDLSPEAYDLPIPPAPYANVA